MHKNSTRFVFSFTLCVILLFVCFSPSTVNAQSDVPDQREITAYNAAINDAAVYKFSNLRPLYPLKFDPTTNTVTVVTLTDYPYTIGTMTLPKDLYLWVTQVPEVQNICRSFTGDLELRLKQLLGLRPGARFTNFVTMTVKEGDIFRPTANPDPTTMLPCSNPITSNCGEASPDCISDAHVKWLANQMLSSYVLSESTVARDGYPWTRLGYTYNWRPGSDKYGASEYVIHPNSTITVTNITPYQTYCTPK